MRLIVMTMVMVLACGAAPGRAEDSYIQPENQPSTMSGDFGGVQAGGLGYDECFRLGWVRGVHVERGEWDDFFRQCVQGNVPPDSGMAVDSVRIDHARVSH